MLAPKLRNRVFELWTMFWSSGMSNPLNAIEQITYLLFLKQLEDLDKERVAKEEESIYQYQGQDYETCRWSYILNAPNYDHIRNVVFPWLRKIDIILNPPSETPEDRPITRYMEDAYFQLDRDKQAMLTRSLKIIEDLFTTATSANADLMGDIFEYLLDEIRSSGKNGQFRTPRHIIRFMIQLVDVGKKDKVLDPAAGSAGFLINSVLHLRQKVTALETMRLEWDGSPHRLTMDNDVEEPYIEECLHGRFFEGYDNDRTMVRIAWMNMVLHGIREPVIVRGDSLGKNFRGKIDHYDVVLTNPPFTGRVDRGDLHERFYRPTGRSGKSTAITSKSELLFVWLVLDALRLGGRAAVVVPEGVLFGSTNAHVALRQELLLKNQLDAVISLPSGVFSPYSGVKTSILLFHKRDELPGDNTPRTPQVWFYEIAEDGYSMDAKREPQPGGDNDLWDALYKYHCLNQPEENTDYYQPQVCPARWHTVDEDFLKLFPELAHEKDQTLGIAERFRDLPRDPAAATQQVVDSHQPDITRLYKLYALEAQAEAIAAAEAKSTTAQQRKAARDVFKKHLRGLDKHFRDLTKEMLEQGKDKDVASFAQDALNDCLDVARKTVHEQALDLLEPEAQAEAQATPFLTQAAEKAREEDPEADLWKAQVEAIITEFAKLDGYDIDLLCLPDSAQRPPDTPVFMQFIPQEPVRTLEETKSWLAPVRVWARDDDWSLKLADGTTLQGSHDDDGNVRPEYVKAHLQEDGSVTDPDLLEPDCIEANDYNLSAGRYKPFKLQDVDYAPPLHIIEALEKLETKHILPGLERLRGMVEGEE